MTARPILVASDLDARNDRAVDRALMLGRRLGRPVALVHVLAKEPDDEGLAEARRQARDSLPDPAAEVEILLPVGPVPEEIGLVADEWHAAMIVCAVARFNALSDYVTGTAVDRIIAHGRRPVLVVKRRPRADYRRIMAAVDFSASSAHALASAAELFPEAEFVLVHAYRLAFEGARQDARLRDEARAAREATMAQFLARPELAGLEGRVRTELAYGAVGEALLDAASQFAPDLVVAGTQGTGPLRRATIGSIASHLLHRMPDDMLVVPPEE